MITSQEYLSGKHGYMNSGRKVYRSTWSVYGLSPVKGISLCLRLSHLMGLLCDNCKACSSLAPCSCYMPPQLKQLPCQTLIFINKSPMLKNRVYVQPSKPSLLYIGHHIGSVKI